MEQAEGSGRLSAPANSARPPVAPKKTEPGAKAAKVSGSGAVRPPSAGISAWEDAAGAHDCDLLAYLGKVEDAVAPGGVRAGSSPGHRTLSQTGDGNLTQALLAARVAAEAERSAAQLEQRSQELERRASQGSCGASGSVSGASDRTGGSGKPPRAPEQRSAPAAGKAGGAGGGGGGGEAADPRLQGLLSDDEDNDDDLVDLMEADDDVLFAGCGDGDKDRSRASGTGGKSATAAPAAPAVAAAVAAAAQPEAATPAALKAQAAAEPELEPATSIALAGRAVGGSGGGVSSGSGAPAGGSRGSSADSGAGAQAAPGRHKQAQGSRTPRGGAAAQAAQPLYGQQSQALLSYQQQYYSQLQQQQQQYTLHGGQPPAPSIPVVQVGEGLRQFQMQPRRAFTPGQPNRSPVRGSGYVVATVANARVLTPPGSPTARGGPSGVQPVGSGVFEPSSVYVGASSAPQPFLGRSLSPHSAEADAHAHAPRDQHQHQQQPGGSQHPHGSPSGAYDHAAPHVADGGGPEATAALLAAFAPTTSPHRHGGGFNMSSWGSPHHGGWAAGGGGGRGGGGGPGRFSSISAGYTGGLVYRSMPISQVPGSAAEDGAAAGGGGGGGGGSGVRSSISPGRLSGRAGKAPTLGLMRDRHGSANATSAGPLAAAAAAAVAAAGSRAATSPRPATSPSRARSFASIGSAVAGPLEPGYARAYAPASRQSPKRASHGAPPAPLVIGGVVMSPPAADGADGAVGQGGPGSEVGTGAAGGALRGPVVLAMPQYLHAPAPIRHCGFGPRPGGHGAGGTGGTSSGSASPPTLAMSGAAGPGSAGSASVAPSVFLGSRAKATDERIRSALLAKVLASGPGGGGGKEQAAPPQHHLLMLAHQQQQHHVAMQQHGHGGLHPHPHQQHHGSPGGAAAEDAAAKGHSAPLAANGMAPAALAGATSSPMHRQGSLPHLPVSGPGEHGAQPAAVFTHPGHPGGFVPHAALPAGPTLAGRIGGGLTPGYGHRGGAPDHQHQHGSSARSYSFDSPRTGAVSHA